MWKQNFVKRTNYLWDQQILFTRCDTNFLNFHSPPPTHFSSISTLAICFSLRHMELAFRSTLWGILTITFPQNWSLRKNCKYKLNCAKDLSEKASWYSYYSHDLILEKTSLRAKIVHRTMIFFFFAITYHGEMNRMASYPQILDLQFRIFMVRDNPYSLPTHQDDVLFHFQ